MLIQIKHKNTQRKEAMEFVKIENLEFLLDLLCVTE